jgi:hypothetical protein
MYVRVCVAEAHSTAMVMYSSSAGARWDAPDWWTYELDLGIWTFWLILDKEYVIW